MATVTASPSTIVAHPNTWLHRTRLSEVGSLKLKCTAAELPLAIRETAWQALRSQIHTV